MPVSQLVTAAVALLFGALAASFFAWRRLAAERSRGRARAQRQRDVVDGIVHEVLTHLHAIRGSIELIERREDAAGETCSHVASAQDASDALLSLAANAQLCLGSTPEPRVDACELGRLFDDLRRRVAPRAAASRVHFEIHFEPDAPRIVEADPSLVAQLLLNVVEHCVAITRHGHVEVTLHGGDGLALTISDTGPSLAPAALRDLFRPFGLAGHVPEGNPVGTGLNLAAARLGAQRLGGSLSCMARDDAGCQYAIRIPARVLERGAPATAPGVVTFFDRYARHRARVAPRSVLVAEDQASNAHVIRHTLERAGHRVEVAEHGATALDRLMSGDFDLAIVDLHLPGMNGLDVMRLHRLRVAGRGRPMPFVVLTGDRSEGARAEARDAGAWGFLRKPVSAQRLLDLLADVCDRAERLADAPSVAEGGIALAAVHRTLLSSDPGHREYEHFRDLFAYLREVERGAALGDWARVRHRTRAIRGVAHLAGASRVAESCSWILSTREDDLPTRWLTLHQQLKQSVDDAWRTLSGVLGELAQGN